MISVYGANATRQSLKQIPMLRPLRAGRYWQGVPHHVLVDAILGEAFTRGWKVKEERYSLSKDKGDLAAAFTLRVPGIAVPEGQTLCLGLLTSNKLRRSLRLVVGTNVKVCNNGMATGQIVLARKHTTGFDLYDEIDNSFTLFERKARRIPHIVYGLRERRLNRHEAEHILMEAGRQGLMPWSRIGKVDREYRQPSFDHGDPRTSWALLNAFTHIVKQNPALEQMDQINGFRELLPTAD